jgi:hypothetical protein
MKVLSLGRYDRLGGSTRLRLVQYIAWARRGIDIDASPLLDDEYLHALYAGGDRSWHKIASAYIERFKPLLKAKRLICCGLRKSCSQCCPR